VTIRARWSRVALLAFVAYLSLGIAGVGTAAADSAPSGGDLHVAQTLGDRELTVVVRRVVGVPEPLEVDVLTHAGTAPGTLELSVAPSNSADAVSGGRVALRLDATPGPYTAMLHVDRAGPWELSVSDGQRTALIPFIVAAVAISPAEAITFGGFIAAGVLLLVSLGCAVWAQRTWVALVPAGGVVAAIAVAITGAVLSASMPLPPQPGIQLDPTAGNVTDPYALSQPLVSDYSRAPATLVLHSAPLAAGRPADVTLSINDAATGAPVDDLLVHDSALIHLLVVGPSGQLWHLHPVRLAPGVFQVRLTLPDPGHYAVAAELGRRGGGNQMLRSATGLDVGVGTPSNPAPPPAGPGPRVVDGVPIALDATAQPAGTPTTITARVGDTATLQPWLGMVGHLIVVGPLNADPAIGSAAQAAPVWAHAHSMTAATMAANNPGNMGGQPDETVAAFGPDVPFTFTFPIPGRYLAWVQVERNYSILTVPAVLDVPATTGGLS
jgi:hypothetical protein